MLLRNVYTAAIAADYNNILCVSIIIPQNKQKTSRKLRYNLHGRPEYQRNVPG